MSLRSESVSGEPIVSLPTGPKPLHFKGGAHGILLFHGLSSSPMELQFVARGLARAGYTVHVPVLRGYTMGLLNEAGVSGGVEDWVAQALAEAARFAAECDSISIGGLCLGAVLALRVAALRGDASCNVLALSTALHYDGWGNPWYTRLLPFARYTPFARRLGIREKYPYGLKDERMRTWVERQFRALGQSDAGAAILRVRDLLHARELIAHTRRSLNLIQAPTLLIHAKEDECATTRSAYEVANRVQSQRVKLVILSDSYHMISIDREKELVLSEIVNFLAQVVPLGQAAESGNDRVLSLSDYREGNIR